MTGIVSWNVQACRGVDGAVDPARIARVVKSMGPADVICLQEISRNDPEQKSGAGADQVAALAQAFPDYEAHFGPAIDRAGGAGGRRWQFGNLVLTRLQAVQAFAHLLPDVADGENKHMQRQAMEIVILDKGKALRVLTTHLDYHSPANREAQIDRLRELQAQAAANEIAPAIPGRGPFAAAPRPNSLVMCGDFNFVAGDSHHARLLSPAHEPSAQFLDAWAVCHGEVPNAPTCGVFDRDQWPDGAHCRDFFFVTIDVADRLRSVEADLETDASDHQPIRLEIDW